METRRLICHPGAVAVAVQNLRVDLDVLPQGHLHFHYELTADLSQIRIPAPLLPRMTDGLWKHTCFEAFIAAEGEAEYHEFNFSPSGQWAAYAFSGYRVRRPWTAIQAPRITSVQTSHGIQLDTHIAAIDFPPNSGSTAFQIGLAAVIETNDGRHSYWALHHPASNPDFHHREGFRITVHSHR